MHSGSSPKLDQYNINGTRICDAFGCRKHKKLRIVRRGMFCKKHARELDDLRKRLKYNPCKTKEELMEEVELRQAEARFRKIMDEAHMEYLLGLERQLEGL